MYGIAPYLTYAATLAIAAAIPGPGIAALVGQSLGGGLRPSLFFVGGMALGDIVYLTITVAGISALAQALAGALLVIKLLGGAYLVYLAYAFWTSKAGLTRVHKSGQRSAGQALFAGFAVSLGNPKIIIFYLALLPTVLNLNGVGISEWLILSALTIAILFCVLTPYAVMAMKARNLMTRSDRLQSLNRVAAGVIGAAGVLIIGQAVAALRRA